MAIQKKPDYRLAYYNLGITYKALEIEMAPWNIIERYSASMRSEAQKLLNTMNN